MKQVIFDRYGPPARVVKCVEAPPPPPPSAWEVTVHITAAAINPSDISVLRGQYGTLPSRLPAGIGLEAAGIITAIGDAVTEYAKGDRVIVVANDNWRQSRNVAASLVHPTPPGLDDLQAAMVKTNSLCAYAMLKDGTGLGPGDYVIQSAPLSAVGRMVIGMAKAMGLRTVNIVRRPEAAAQVRALGGDVAPVDGEDLGARVARATGNAPIMLGFDGVAGEATSRMADCMEVGGTIVSYGMLSGEPIVLRPDHTIFRDIRLKGFWLSKVLGRVPQKERRSLLSGCLDLMIANGLANEVDRTFPLDRISEAIDYVEGGARRGKVMLLPNGPIGSEAAAPAEARAPDRLSAMIGELVS